MAWSRTVPGIVQAKARANGAIVWLDQLPDLVDELAERWSLTIGTVFDGGTEALVLAARRADDTDAVLKIGIPRDGRPAANEIAVLRHARGRGCAELFEADVELGAMLVERLGPSLNDLGWPLRRRHEVLCTAASAMWSPAGDANDLGLMSGADKAHWLVDFITSAWDRLDRPCSEAAVEHAVTAAERRADAHEVERSVLVHGDVHEWNALRVPGTDTFKLIDPDGLVAEPEYDLGVMMREDPIELLDGDPHDRARRLASITVSPQSLDSAAIWEWGVVERVSTGLIAVEIGLQPVGDQMLRAADIIAADDRTR